MTKHTKAVRLGWRIKQLRRAAVEAPTAQSQLAAAYDYFRMVAHHNPDAVVMNEMAVALVTAGDRLEPGARAEICARI